MLDIDDFMMRRALRRNLPKLVKNVTDQNEYSHDSAIDMLRLFCWQVEHGQALDSGLLKYVSAAFSKVVSDGVSADAALGLTRGQGAPKADPERDFWVAIWVKKVMFGCLKDSELTNNNYLPITQEQINRARKRCVQKRKKPSLTYAYELVGEYCGLSASAVRKIHDDVMATDVCQPLNQASSAEELEQLLNPNRLYLIVGKA